MIPVIVVNLVEQNVPIWIVYLIHHRSAHSLHPWQPLYLSQELTIASFVTTLNPVNQNERIQASPMKPRSANHRHCLHLAEAIRHSFQLNRNWFLVRKHSVINSSHRSWPWIFISAMHIEKSKRPQRPLHYHHHHHQLRRHRRRYCQFQVLEMKKTWRIF